VGGILEVPSRDTGNLLNDILAGLGDSREKNSEDIDSVSDISTKRIPINLSCIIEAGS
jgi:hypothetical protein